MNVNNIKRKIQGHSQTIETEQSFLAKNAKKLNESRSIFNDRLSNALSKFEPENVNEPALQEVEQEKEQADQVLEQAITVRQEIETQPNVNEEELEKAIQGEMLSQDKVKEMAEKYNWVLKKINTKLGTSLTGNIATVICDDINSYVGTGENGCFKQCSDKFKSVENNSQFFECNTRRSSTDIPTGKMYLNSKFTPYWVGDGIPNRNLDIDALTNCAREVDGENYKSFYIDYDGGCVKKEWQKM